MNERSKQLLKEQKTGIYNNLQQFNLPVFEDELAEDEESSLDVNGYNCFIFETGEFTPTQDIKKLNQSVNVQYFSEKRDDVDEQAIDIISTLTSIKGVYFVGSTKERLRMKDTDRFIDRVTINFVRKIPIEVRS